MTLVLRVMLLAFEKYAYALVLFFEIIWRVTAALSYTKVLKPPLVLFLFYYVNCVVMYVITSFQSKLAKYLLSCLQMFHLPEFALTYHLGYILSNICMYLFFQFL